MKEKQRFWADRNSWKHGEADVQGILTWCGYVGFLGPCRNACTPLGPCEDLGKGREGWLRLSRLGCGGRAVPDLLDPERERLPGAPRLMTNPLSHEAPLTREEDSATALGGIQGQLVKGEDLAPGLEDATPGAAAHSQSTHLGDRGRAWSEPPGRRPRSCWDLWSPAQIQQEFRLLILPDDQLLEANT